MRASSCDSFGVLLAEQMKSMSTSNDNNAKNNTNTIAAGADLRIPSKSTLLGEEGEEGKSARENNIDIDIDKKNSKYINRLSDRNSEIFLNTDQIPYEKATVITKLQKRGD